MQSPFWTFVLLVLLHMMQKPYFVSPLLLYVQLLANGNKKLGTRQPRTFKYSEQPSHDNEGEDDDDDEVTAYKNRSVAWTRRYRKLIPYEKARARAMSLGLRSPDEWDDFLQDGKSYQHGPYLPSRPDLMYADDWVSWDEFLGIMRPYEDARSVVQMIGLRNETQYRKFVMDDPKRAEGLRIPAKPEIVYRNKGWISHSHFLGKEKD